jgi:hypothetical protein
VRKAIYDRRMTHAPPMGVRHRTSLFVALVVVGTVGLAAGIAGAFGPGAPNPHANMHVRRMPAACRTHPTGAVCVNAAVWYLDRDRAAMGKPPYALPARFVSLGPVRQAFILANLDRIAYRLPPIAGMTSGLDRDALTGARANADPTPSGSFWQGFTSNFAAGYPNMAAAYQAWMFDDGIGSGNVDCSNRHRAGCWGHRQDVLWNFASTGAPAPGLAMGAAMTGTRQTLLIAAHYGGRLPRLAYTWGQARAAGAGSHVYRVAAPH